VLATDLGTVFTTKGEGKGTWTRPSLTGPGIASRARRFCHGGYASRPRHYLSCLSSRRPQAFDQERPSRKHTVLTGKGRAHPCRGVSQAASAGFLILIQARLTARSPAKTAVEPSFCLRNAKSEIQGGPHPTSTCHPRRPRLALVSAAPARTENPCHDRSLAVSGSSHGTGSRPAVIRLPRFQKTFSRRVPFLARPCIGSYTAIGPRGSVL